MKKPIEFFKNDTQFQECCKWWQHKLSLDDWIVEFKMVDSFLTDETGERILSGVCEFEFNNKEATITICNVKNDTLSSIKNVAELTIVHELLHIRNEYMLDVEDDTDKSFHKYIAHQSLESMAKSLIMVKYNLNFDYFLKGEIDSGKNTEKKD